MTNSLTEAERREWLIAHANWSDDLPDEDKKRIEAEYSDNSILLAIASGFN